MRKSQKKFTIINLPKDIQKIKDEIRCRDLMSLNSFGKAYISQRSPSEEDYKRGVAYLAVAAELGYAPAQCNMGVCYLSGFGLKKNPKKAVQWFELAVEKGDSTALWPLSRCRWSGVGCKQNQAHAFALCQESLCETARITGKRKVDEYRFDFLIKMLRVAHKEGFLISNNNAVLTFLDQTQVIMSPNKAQSVLPYRVISPTRAEIGLKPKSVSQAFQS